MLEGAEDGSLGNSRAGGYTDTEKREMRSNVRASMR
jgi:hypothetical protein